MIWIRFQIDLQFIYTSTTESAKKFDHPVYTEKILKSIISGGTNEVLNNRHNKIVSWDIFMFFEILWLNFGLNVRQLFF